MELVKITDLFYYINDGTHETPIYTEVGVPFYSVEDITSNFTCKKKFISKQLSDKLNQRCNPEYGDILMTRIGSIGDVKKITYHHQSSIYVSLALLKPNKDIELDYVYTYMKSQIFRNDVFNHSLKNATPIKINTQAIKELAIPFIGTKKSRDTIINIMETVDNLIDSLKKELMKETNILSGIVNKVFVQSENMTTISEFVNVQNGFAFNSSDFVQDGVKIIRIGDIQNGKINLLNCASIPSNKIVKDEFVAKKGDYMLAMSGATTGKVGVYESTSKAYINQRVAKLTAKNDSIYEYLYFYFVSDLYKKNLQTILTAGAQPNISPSQIKSLPINYIEDKDGQLLKLMTSLKNKIDYLDKKVSKYEQIREGLLDGLFTGKIDVPADYKEV